MSREEAAVFIAMILCMTIVSVAWLVVNG